MMMMMRECRMMENRSRCEYGIYRIQAAARSSSCQIFQLPARVPLFAALGTRQVQIEIVSDCALAQAQRPINR